MKTLQKPKEEWAGGGGWTPQKCYRRTNCWLRAVGTECTSVLRIIIILVAYQTIDSLGPPRNFA